MSTHEPESPLAAWKAQHDADPGTRATPAGLRRFATELDDTPATGYISWQMGCTADALRAAADQIEHLEHQYGLAMRRLIELDPEPPPPPGPGPQMPPVPPRPRPVA